MTSFCSEKGRRQRHGAAGRRLCTRPTAANNINIMNLFRVFDVLRRKGWCRAHPLSSEESKADEKLVAAGQPESILCFFPPRRAKVRVSFKRSFLSFLADLPPAKSLRFWPSNPVPECMPSLYRSGVYGEGR